MHFSRIFNPPLSRFTHYRYFATKRRDKVEVTAIITATADQQWNLPVFIHDPPNKSQLSPILLICGWAGAGSKDWGSIAKILSSKTNRTILTYDARGVGNSTRIQNTISTYFDLSLQKMAEDALSVVKCYYKYKRIGNSDQQKEFCVGGVSLGGMVAQALAHLLHSDKDGDYSISSLGLISSAPIRKLTKTRSIGVHESPCSIQSIIPDDHFLLSFDGFHAENDEQRQNSIKNFFSALGNDFLSRPGRKTFRDKLVASFLSTRGDFVNGIGVDSIHAQRHVLINESYGLWNDHGELLQLGKLDVPSIVVHGEKDSVIPFHHGRKLHEIMSYTDEPLSFTDGHRRSIAEFSSISNCDHLCWITHGQEVVEIIGNFFLKIQTKNTIV